MKFQLLLYLVLLVPACSALFNNTYYFHWTPYVSEEEGHEDPAICEFGFATGFRCRGRYCDDVALRCVAGIHPADSNWLESFSEEHGAMSCPAGQFVSGVRCSGSYCDNMSLRCSSSRLVNNTGNCFWSQPISEEDNGKIELASGTYIAGIECDGRYCDNKRIKVCDSNEVAASCSTERCHHEIASRFAPILRFDRKQGNPNKCFPSDAGYYYFQRKNGFRGRICETDYELVKNGRTPTYYDIKNCGSDTVVIAYWWFYGYQDYCSRGLGDHNADWEHVVVKVTDGRLNRVSFSQHNGNYTKLLGNFERDGDHPIAYVGKNSHGSYHDDGGSGSCLYFEDFRNPGPSDKRLKSWMNLVKMPHDSSDHVPEWMNCPNGWVEYFDGIPPPNCRNMDLCNLRGCVGDALRLGALCAGQCGCSKSDIGKNPF